MIDKLLQSKRLKVGIAIMLAVSLLLLCFSLFYPAAKRAERIDMVGGNGLSATASLSTSMSYFAGDTLTKLKQNPTVNDDYRSLCGLLTRVKESYGFERTYVIYKGVGGKYYYLLDAGYRDNATVGVDYQTPGAEFSGPVQKATRSVVDRVYNQKVPADFGRDIITTTDHRKVIVSFVPLLDTQGSMLGLLVVESAAGNTDFAKVGLVDFQLLAIVSGVVFLVGILLAMALRSLQKSRHAKRETMLEATAVKVDAEVLPLEANHPSDVPAEAGEAPEAQKTASPDELDPFGFEKNPDDEA